MLPPFSTKQNPPPVEWPFSADRKRLSSASVQSLTVARISLTKRPRRFRRGLREARTYGAASRARMRPYQMPPLLFVNAMPGTPHPKLLTTVAPGRLVA